MYAWLQAGFVLAATFLSPPVSPDKYPEEWRADGKGQTYVLYRRHGVTAMSQGRVGSCVGAAAAKALEMMHGVEFSTEWIYGKSRSYFGKKSGAGSNCVWAAQMLCDVGAVPSWNYAILGFDLSSYDPSLAYSWQRGPPEILEWISARYRSPGYVKIRTFEELRDAIAQGYPVIVGSSIGFGPKSGARRTSDGMLHSRWWSRWNHAMVICGVSDGKSKRALLLNSWGEKWISGPKWIGDEPEGSFWISKQDAEKILSHGDSYAILPIVGLSR